MANAVNRTAIIANSTASGVIPPANDVAAPIDSAVATAGAMWVIDWNSTSGSPIASRSSDGAAPPTGRSFAVILTLLSMPRSAGKSWAADAGANPREIVCGQAPLGKRLAGPTG